MSPDSYVCPTCGTEVVVGMACPGCVPKRKKRTRKKVGAGPKKRKPWEQDAIYDGLAVPDDEFDYEEFVTKEFGRKPHRQIGIRWYWWATGVVLAGLFGWAVLSGLF